MESSKVAFLLAAMLVATLAPSAFASRNELQAMPQPQLFDGSNVNAFTKFPPQIRYVNVPLSTIFPDSSNLRADCLSFSSFCSWFSLPCCGQCTCQPIGAGICIGAGC